MGVIENSETLAKFSKNDWFEYKQVCKEIKEAAKYYEDNIANLKVGRIFIADFAFNTSDTALFFNIKVKFIVKRRFRRKRVFFTTTEVVEIIWDDYLDMINETKKYINEGEEDEEQ